MSLSPSSIHNMGPQGAGHHGHTIASQSMRSPYKAYRSPFAPKYKTGANYHGITPQLATKYATMAAGFGGVAGFFALWFFAEVPRVRDDIVKKIPVIGDFFVKEIAPEDNPF